MDPEHGFAIVDVLRNVAERHQVGVPRTTLAWPLARRGVTSVIAGARRPAIPHGPGMLAGTFCRLYFDRNE